jgi:hypothetical protein
MTYPVPGKETFNFAANFGDIQGYLLTLCNTWTLDFMKVLECHATNYSIVFYTSKQKYVRYF